MKRYLMLSALGLAFVYSGVAYSADTKSVGEARFFGKIISVDQAQKNVTVHNNRRKQDAQFSWDDKTGIVDNKTPISSSHLKVGQFLMVSYVMDGDVNKATKITVRPAPFHKREPKESIQ
jgi:hypothetical protein